MDEIRLNRFAEAILDGDGFDLAPLESTADADERALARELQIVAQIAAVHRPGPHRSGGAAAAAAPAVRQWGHLRIDAAIGRGSYGHVYRAWDPHLEREVALKLLFSASRIEDGSVTLSDPRRVVNEGRLLARVRHPHVITVYGADTRDAVVGIWMELIHGRTLHDVVSGDGTMSAREASAVGIDLGSALAAVHGAGLLHRDVSARNVMREDGGRIVLMDFGTGDDERASSEAPRETLTGTPVYMAPELLDGSPPSVRSDLYALGVLLFFLVTGRYPVNGRSIADIRATHARGGRTRLRDARPDLPAPFVEVVETALAAEPARRFATAGEFELALQRILGAPSAVSQRGWKRQLSVAALLVASIAGALSVVAPRAPTQAAPGDIGQSGVAARRLTVPDGVSVLSNPSADGRYVAAMLNQTGGAALVDLSTGMIRAIDVKGTGGDGYASLTALSPDASQVAIDWHTGTKGALLVAATDGSGYRVLLDRVQDVYPHEWSRDGNYILTHITEENGGEVIALVAVSDGAVRVLGRLSVGRPERMSLSPDGRYVVYDMPERASPRDRDVMILDAHTGAQRPLVVAAGHDRSPLWTPDGQSVLFLSDRNRSLSAWAIDVQQGRPSGAPRLVKDNVGRVWLRGFTDDGQLHYQLNAGYAEVYLGSVDSPDVTPISPRQAVSNFYPVWSNDGRYLAYTSERRPDSAAERDLWVYDTLRNQEVLIAEHQSFGRPLAWSPDDRHILAAGPNTQELLRVDRDSGEVHAIGENVLQAHWFAEGIVASSPTGVVVLDPTTLRPIRRHGPASDSTGFSLGLDGRFVLEHTRDGVLRLESTTAATAFSWQDVAISRLARHAAAEDGSAIAYTATTTATPESMVLKVWDGREPRELMRVQSPERIVLVGWTRSGDVVAVHRRPPSGDVGRPDTLWRLPIDGRPPIRSAVALEALRDFSFHPDGRRWAFNAGFKRGEYWALENLLP